MGSARDETEEPRHHRPEAAGLAGGRGEQAPPAPSSEPTETSKPAGDEGRPTPTATRVAQAAILLVAALFAVFALVNSQPVDFSWVFGETRTTRDATGEVTSGGVPLIVLLLVSFIVGAVLGGWWTWQAARSRRRVRDGRR